MLLLIFKSKIVPIPKKITVFGVTTDKVSSTSKTMGTTKSL